MPDSACCICWLFDDVSMFTPNLLAKSLAAFSSEGASLMAVVISPTISGVMAISRTRMLTTSPSITTAVAKPRLRPLPTSQPTAGAMAK